MAVIGRSLLARLGDEAIAAEVAAVRAPGRILRSENGFRRLLAGTAGALGALDGLALAAQSGLGADDLAMLALFDGFEHDVEPFAFRDAILARKYAGLIAGGVGIGGVLEPPNATPVIVEDGAFLGSRCIVTEGVRIGAGAVLAANVSLTASVPVIDVTGPEPVEHRGSVPARRIDRYFPDEAG